MSKHKICCLKKMELIDDTNDIPIKLCNECRIHHASHVRRMNIDKVPKEFFLQPTDTSSFILTNTHKIDFSDLRNFLNLPKEHRLTKYDYYLCTHCYRHYHKNNEPVWTQWFDM